MNKLLLTIITLIYLMVSSGIAMDVHYCMGEKVGESFAISSNEKCGKCGMKEKKGGCCKDEHHFYKYENNYKNVSNYFISIFEIVITKPPYFFEKSFLFYKETTFLYKANAPPDITKPLLYIRNRNFRI